MAFNFSRALCRATLNKQLGGLNNATFQARTVTMKVVPADSHPGESHDERNARLKRPQSPHLSIYKPQLTSMLSITHRMTGMALSGYAFAFGLGALVLPHDATHYLTMLEGLHLSAPTLMVTKFVLAYPAAYHLVNGCRHLMWDLGKFLTIKEVYSTGYTMVAVATVLAAVFAAL